MLFGRAPTHQRSCSRLTDTVLCNIAVAVFRRHGLFSKYNIDEAIFGAWVSQISTGYFSNPYHSWYANAQFLVIQSLTLFSVHAADVLQATNVMILNLRGELPPWNLLTVFTAAIIHDYNHPGVNNNFLYRTMDPLAIQYNGISVSLHFFWILLFIFRILTSFFSARVGRFWKICTAKKLSRLLCTVETIGCRVSRRKSSWSFTKQ